MAKIRIRSGRGTKIIEIEDKGKNWSGQEFKKQQEERKDSSKGKYISVGRGTGKIKFGDIPSSPTKSTKGMWVSSGRGTGRRQLRK